MLTFASTRALDTELAAYIQQNLPVGTSYETLKALGNAIMYVMNGAGFNKNVEFAGRGEILTNMAAAETLLRASPGSAKKIDLTHYTQARLVCVMGGVAAPAGGKCIAKFKATLGANAAAYAALGTTAIEALMDTIDVAVDSGWTSIAAAARADVFVAITTSGGDGAIDPVVGNMELQFR